MTAAIARPASRRLAQKVAAPVSMACTALSTGCPRPGRRGAAGARPVSLGLRALRLRGVRGRRQMNAELLDPPLVGFKDFELDPARVTHTLAARRDGAGDGENKAAESIDVLPILLRDERESELLLEVLDRRARLGDETGP